MRPAKHEGLITFETFKTIQDRLNGIARVPARKDINEDFPLRGFVQCGCCGTPLTANWSKGKTASYPCYQCRQKGCEAYGKSIRREVVKGDFKKIIKSLRPSEDLFEFASSLFRDLWDQRGEAMKARRQSMTAEVSQVDRKIAQLMDRLVEADNESVVRAYEKRIGDLKMQRAVLRKRIEKCGQPLHTYEESFELSMAFLSNPWFIGKMEELSTVRRC